MNKYKVFSKMWFLALLLVTFVAGCASNGTEVVPPGAGALVSIVLTPPQTSTPVTGNVQYTVTAIYSNGSSSNVTAISTFTAGTAGVSFGATKGLATGVTANVVPVVITATFGGKTATANLTVNDATSRFLKLTPITASIPVSGNQQYSVLEIFSDGTSQPRTTDLATSWATSSNSGNATLTASGPGAGLAVGLVATPVNVPVVITATYGGKTATANLTVNAATSKFLMLTPVSASIPVTGNQQYTLLEIFSDGTSQPRTTDLATGWATSNNNGNASLTGSGVGAGLAVGLIETPVNAPVTITATYGGKTATANLTVNAATSKSLKLTPITASIPVTGNQQYSVLEIFSDGTSQIRTTDLTTSWATLNNAGNASLTPSGPTAGLAVGLVATPVNAPVTITATYGGKTATADLTVNGATSKKFEVTPATATISINGGGQQFAAIETFTDGTSYDRTLASNWSAVDVAPAIGVATIGLNTGIATGAVIGKSTITATYTVGSVIQTGSAVLTVTAPNPELAGTVNLGTAATYGVMANSGITLSAAAKTHIYGDVGILANSSFTGFALNIASPSPASPTSLYVTGQITSGPNATTGYNNNNFAAMVTAFNDLNTAWVKNNPTNNPAPATAPSGALPKGGTFVAAGKDLTGLLLGPGIYASNIPTGTLALSNASGPLVLDAGGNPDAVFIFQAGDITTTSGSVILRNGAQSKNVFWVITNTATIGDGTVATSFAGTILAGTAVTVGLDSSVEGRVLAGAGLVSGILTINGGVITVP